MEFLKNLAMVLRGLQLYAHHAHNLAKGQTFLEDHEFFAEIYTAAERDYDSLIERILGLGETVDSLQLSAEALDLVKDLPKMPQSNLEFFQGIKRLEELVCSYIQEHCKSSGLSEGTYQLVGTIADMSESRLYKIKRRLM